MSWLHWLFHPVLSCQVSFTNPSSLVLSWRPDSFIKSRLSWNLKYYILNKREYLVLSKTTWQSLVWSCCLWLVFLTSGLVYFSLNCLFLVLSSTPRLSTSDLVSYNSTSLFVVILHCSYNLTLLFVVLSTKTRLSALNNWSLFWSCCKLWLVSLILVLSFTT